ncbi:MAG: pyridoxal phosphate-dependent aminotransferase [Xanthomonadales bacterium]|nr:pyridoxal phosphate-dependent aminotransferase [Xanthomonadales bacterium]ODU94625.1 MAG: aminotransferase [Rhodanobacter sp. SCN 66-43]OJY85207.1 MAG: aminotransferase [Xanthomonadales bacterium 66-474]
MPRLATRTGRAKPSAIMVIADKARQLKAEGKDVVNFSIGVPNFLPGEHVYAAVRDWTQHDSGAYGSNRGSPELLDAIVAHLQQSGLDGYTRNHITVGIGAKQVLYNLCEALLDEGDEIVFPAPYWTSYVDIAEILGARATILPCPPEQHYKLTPAQLDKALASNPKVFLFNNPSNPTGMVYTRDEIAALADVLAKHPNTWIIADDIYNRLVFDGIGYHNVVQFRPELRERTFIMDSLSKTYGMPGWRVGFVAGPEAGVKALVTLNSNHITCLPEIITAAAVAALNGPQDIPAAKREEFAKRRDDVLQALRAIPGVKCPRPQGAFYAFPDISVAFGKSHNGKPIENDVDFCKTLLEEKFVATVPGSAFGEPRSLRISYTCAPAQLQKGLARIQEFFAELSDARAERARAANA